MTNVGRGPFSAALSERTVATTVPSVPLNLRTDAPGGGLMDLTWTAPTDNGGAAIMAYDIRVTDPNGIVWPVDRTPTLSLSHRVPWSAGVSALRFPGKGDQLRWCRAIH